MGHFPQRRLVPVAVAAALFLVLGTAQRGMLLALVRRGAQLDLHECWEALVLGARTDLAVAALLSAPFLLWVTLLPEAAWKARAHRLLGGAVLAAGLASLLAFLALEAMVFATTWTRFGPGSRSLLRGWWNEMLDRHGPAAPAGIAVAALGLGIALAMLLRPLLAIGWSQRARFSDRLRDLLLIASLSLLAVLTAPRLDASTPRPWREAASSGIPRAGMVAWRFVEPRLRSAGELPSAPDRRR